MGQKIQGPIPPRTALGVLEGDPALAKQVAKGSTCQETSPRCGLGLPSTKNLGPLRRLYSLKN